MQDRTETLELGALAPEFLLPSANRESSTFSLSILREHGTVIMEFLRGTW
ncbi:MAG: hypothetical protein ACRD3L_09785 [Terriglobales bacterium]